jgi:hypothetical protein
VNGGELAGRLTEIVTVQRPSHQSDAIGGASGLFEHIGTIRAEVVAEGVGALGEGDARTAMPRFRLMARVQPQLLPGDSLIWQSRRYRTLWVETVHRPVPVQRAVMEETR